MNSADQQRLAELRSKLRRLNGHKTLSAKQKACANELMWQITLLDGTDIEAFLEKLRQGKLSS